MRVGHPGPPKAATEIGRLHNPSPPFEPQRPEGVQLGTSAPHDQSGGTDATRGFSMAINRDASKTPINATRARQGRMGRPIVVILVISTLLAIIALFAAWGWRADDLASTAPDNARQPSDAAAFDAPAPAVQHTP